MKKENLKTGMRVETRNGDIYLVLKDIDTHFYGHQDIGFACDGDFLEGTKFNNDLTYDGNRDYDIVKVYQINSSPKSFLNTVTLNLDKRFLIWEREEELRPCPFCGSTESLVVGTDEELGLSKRGEGSGYYQVCCCFTKGGCGSAGGFKETKEESIKLWNERK